MKRTGWTPRYLLLLAALLLALGLVGGCGKKEAGPETNPEAVTEEPGMGEEEAVSQEPVTPETPATETAPNYAAMTPAELGIEDVFFDFDEYDLDDEALRKLSQDARTLREHSDYVVLIEGHCDERGTVEYNLALGEKRANAVRDYLLSLGVGSRQLRTVSYGENKPFAHGHDESAWALNRRAHFSRP